MTKFPRLTPPIDDAGPPGLKPPAFAPWVSAAAQRTFQDEVAGKAGRFETIAEARVYYDLENQRRLKTMRALFPAATASSTLGGVALDIVAPDGQAPELRPDAPVLICLHGGGFAWGAGAGALLEAVPIAAVSGMTVVAVDYRMSPEHKHPAAVEDVVAVYRALLKDRPAQRIGLFGCSAGGVLVTQTLAALQAANAPRPGAAAMLHAAGVELGGDSLALAAAMTGDAPSLGISSLASLPYLADADPSDPMVFPGGHPEVLAKFPPSLLITSTRDFAASSVSVMHRRLLTAGVEADFILFDGLWHAFHMSGDLPESQELYARVAEFFTRRLK